MDKEKALVLSIRVYAVADGYVVADQAGWLPGIYETPRAALNAVPVNSNKEKNNVG